MHAIRISGRTTIDCGTAYSRNEWLNSRITSVMSEMGNKPEQNANTLGIGMMTPGHVSQKQPSVERFPQLSISHTHYKLQTKLLLRTTCNGHNLNPYLSQLYAQFRRRRATERFSDSEETAMAERRQAYSTYHRQRNSEVNYNNGTRCQ
jgi:hypothetical protein